MTALTSAGAYGGPARAEASAEASAGTQARSWPWPAWNAAARDGRARLFKAMAGLRVTGCEASVRLTVDATERRITSVETGRWVVAIDPQGMGPRQRGAVIEAVGAVGTPELEAALTGAHRIGLGLEQRGQGCRLKLYVEHALPRPQAALLPGQQPGCALMIQAWKSPAEPEARWTRTEYWRLSGWSAAQLLSFLAEARAQREGEGAAEAWSLGSIERAVRQAHRLKPRWAEPIVVRILDEDGGRQGYGVRLYGSGLTLKDGLTHLLDDFSTTAKPQECFDATDSWGDLPNTFKHELGWCHTGVVTNHNMYMICYAPVVISTLLATP